MDGKLNVVNIFYGIVVFSIKTGPPLFHSNQSLFSVKQYIFISFKYFSLHFCFVSLQVTHNSKSIRLIPSLQGSLYRWNLNHRIEPLYISIEKILANNLHTSDVLFTGCKQTYIKPLIENMKNNAVKAARAQFEPDINMHEPNILIKRTMQKLLAHDRNNHKKLYVNNFYTI